MPGTHPGTPFGRGNGDSRSGWIPAIHWLPSGHGQRCSIYSGVDHLGTVGKLAPGLFAQQGRDWRMVAEKPSRPHWVLHGAGDLGRAMEVLGGWEEGVVVRATR